MKRRPPATPPAPEPPTPEAMESPATPEDQEAGAIAAAAARSASLPTGGDERLGIECRRCGCQHFLVLYTRPAPRGRIKRRRECRHCGARMTTFEGGG